MAFLKSASILCLPCLPLVAHGQQFEAPLAAAFLYGVIVSLATLAIFGYTTKWSFCPRAKMPLAAAEYGACGRGRFGRLTVKVSPD
jgi:H+/gluconate symporter-like permease